MARFAYDTRTERVSRMVGRTSSDVSGDAEEFLGRSYDRQRLVLTDTTKRQVNGVAQVRIQRFAYNARGLLASVRTSSPQVASIATARCSQVHTKAAVRLRRAAGMR